MTQCGWHGTIAELAACETPPLSDGMLLDWVRQQQPRASDVPALITLFAKADPHLQEAAVELATMLVRIVSGALMHLEASLATLAGGHLDPWVVEALVELLEHVPSPRVILALAPRHVAELAPRHVAELAPRPLPTRPPSPRGTPPARQFIVRSRMPQPWLRLEQLYAQLALARGATPAAHDLAYLPILEARLATTGWEQTLDVLRARMRR